MYPLQKLLSIILYLRITNFTIDCAHLSEPTFILTTMSETKLLLLVIDLIFIHTVDSSNVHYITPTQCPVEESCLTLSTLAANINNYLNSNTTVVFLEGNHFLDSGLVVSNIDGSLTLSTNGSGTAAIICSDRVRPSLKFKNINQLQISGLEFIGCSSKVERVDQFTLEDSRFHGGSDNSALHLTHTNTNIVCSYFASNTAGTYQNHVEVLAYVRDNRYDIRYPYPTIRSTSARVGGALTVTSSTVNISSSRFESNTATVGGAIFSQLRSDMTISNSTFISNSATGCSDDRCHGGALFIDSGCTVTAHNSTFIDNTAGYGGGAISLFQGTFIDSTHNVYSSNRADGLGGAISAYCRSRITIDNSYYSNNSGRYGGVVYTQRYGSITIGNSSFDNNEADRDGGVMYASSSSSITVGNSSFDNNEADRDGGVMYASSSSSITVGNSSFDNSAGRDGGVMCASFSSITVGNSSFDNNEADRDGGVMYASSGSSITVGNSSFDNSTAGRDGGVMCASSGSSITVGNSSFDNSTAGRDGGVMCASFSSIITVGNSSFDNNEAGSDGGVMYASSGSSITVGNSSFDNNEAGRDGGVMLAYDSSNITVGNSSFDNNEAGCDGGVMLAHYSSNITVGNSSFDNNVAGHDGGVVYGTNTIRIYDLDIGQLLCFNDGTNTTTIIFKNNCKFFNNSANEGGVIYVRDAHFMDLGSMYYGNMASNGGVITLNEGFVEETASRFMNNTAGNSGGVLYSPLYNYAHVIKLETSYFINNSAISGGAVAVLSNATVTVTESNFTYNNAIRGGVIYALIGNNFTASYSNFSHNLAKSDGGMVYSENQNRLEFKNCQLDFNRADNNGGVVCLLFQSELNITGDNCFIGNQAHTGGVVYASESIINIHNQTLLMVNNTAIESGGAVYLAAASLTLFSGNHMLVGNQAHSGGVVYARESIIYVYSQSLLTDNNSATETGGAAYVSNTDLTFFSGNNRLVHNQAHSGGALYASDSRVRAYSESLLLANNTARDTGGAVYLSKANLSFVSGNNTFIKNEAMAGGAIHLNKGKLIFSGNNTFIKNEAMAGGAIHLNKGKLIFSGGNSKLVENKADDGGAIYVSESKLIIETDSQTKIYANSAIRHGGGLYLTMSELKIKGESLYITRNRANNSGGGIFSTNSSIIVEGAVYFVSNEAENGGGVSLERNAKLHGTLAGNSHIINFVTNRASHYGGALYVDDATNPDMCRAVNNQSNIWSIDSECFSKLVFINISDNSAGVSGPNLFGGLLDRCTVHNEISKEYQTGIMSFQNSSNINESQLDTISSHPVQLCFCRDGQPDCNYQPEPIQVIRGKIFSVELIAYDQVHHAVNASIQCSLNSLTGGLGEGQQTQNINKACTALKYNLFTPNNYEGLTFSPARAPCNNISGISERSVVIEIICSCPIGFQISNDNETSCDCICDQVLQSYEKTECNPKTESIIRRENFWISYINHTWSNSSGYVIYPHCPFDYCYTPDKQVSVNLNLPNGSDAQCDSDRTGTLCGTCKPGLSVSLGSSKCVHCPTYWPGLLVTIAIVFILSGIGLVAFLLALNLTVAIGTLNAIIFYANIVAANKSALFPSGVSFASVFISWLNFDLGFDICFFDGMDTYIKTWLQLAFPAYIIILVVVIIQLSYYFDAFGRLVGKKDPVATLATLILLSYAKLLQTIITAFSSATLDYPDGSKKIVWLPDATIEYFTSKHAGLFFTAILILLVGLLYTLLLFSWQWFLCCPRKRVKWIRNQKLSAFMEIYLVPYTPNHRYWTGLLLLVRVIVYLVSAFNPSGDPRVTLSVTTFIMSSLLLYIATFGVRMYKNRFINTMETLTYFNIIALSIFTWYTIDVDTNHQAAVTNISVGITFIQLTAVIIYHVYKHTNQKLSAMIQGSVIFVKVKGKFSKKKQKKVNHEPVPADEDIHQIYKLLDMIDRPVNTNDYNIPQVKPKPVEPTLSVVEPPKPLLIPANPPPLEAINEESDLESGEQESEQYGIEVIQVENISQGINKNKKSINNYLGVEIVDSECNNTSTNPESEMEHDIILKENSIPKSHSNPQINNGSDLDKEEAMEMPRSDNMDQSSEEAAPLPAASGEQEGVGSHCVIVEAEIHDY